jgi:Dna[CI] antecedent, DciA
MRKPIAVSDLLKEGQATLQRLKAGAEASSQVLAAVRLSLPGELANHVFGAQVTEGRLTVVVDSGGWATRVRYAATELAPKVGEALGAGITAVRVQVRPRPR